MDGHSMPCVTCLGEKHWILKLNESVFVFGLQICNWSHYRCSVRFWWWGLPLCANLRRLCNATFHNEDGYCWQVSVHWKCCHATESIFVACERQTVVLFLLIYCTSTFCAMWRASFSCFLFFIFLFNRDITTFLRLLLRKEGFNFHSSSEMEIVRTIKEVRPNTVAMVFIRRVRVKESSSIISLLLLKSFVCNGHWLEKTSMLDHQKK